MRIKRRKEKYIQYGGYVTQEEAHEEERIRKEKTRKNGWTRNFRYRRRIFNHSILTNL